MVELIKKSINNMRGFKWIYVKNKARSTSIKSITNTYFVVITLVFLRYITYYLYLVKLGGISCSLF